MIRTILTAILCTALALPATAQQQRPTGRDMAVVLGGLVALYALKETIDRRNDRKRARREAARPEPRAHRADRRLRAPDRCLRAHRTDRGVVRGYGARCMQDRVVGPGLLPPRCLRRLRTDRGRRAVYAPRCLHREGWRVARR
ncbi:hypothetical protein [Jannaschia sp. LMIT008]|uniref:hypothetical protein n=1 Tax=Jannaschia maritima TaxID=3032585 RepID=UPI0028119232|nr:hypothetical protein [Jannaschia sp. LMIT008]